VGVCSYTHACALKRGLRVFGGRRFRSVVEQGAQSRPVSWTSSLRLLVVASKRTLARMSSAVVRWPSSVAAYAAYWCSVSELIAASRSECHLYSWWLCCSSSSPPCPASPAAAKSAGGLGLASSCQRGASGSAWGNQPQQSTRHETECGLRATMPQGGQSVAKNHAVEDDPKKPIPKPLRHDRGRCKGQVESDRNRKQRYDLR
jgi:hypothetical protein